MRLRAVLTVGTSVLLTAASPAVVQAAPTFADLPAGPGATTTAPGADGGVWFTQGTDPGAIGRITTDASTTTTYTGGLTPGFAKDAQPQSITPGPGGLWFTENAKNRIGRITAAGTVTEFTTNVPNRPAGIVAGPDGNLWFTAAGAIARITPAGSVTKYPSTGNPQDITLGADGNLWFTLAVTKSIGRITPQGVITEFAAGILTGTPAGIAAGPDGNVWFTQSGPLASIGRITMAGAIMQFSAGLPMNTFPVDIATGADGNLYVTDDGADVIERVTPSGAISQYGAALAGGAGPRGISTGPDGRLWFADYDRGRLGRVSVAPTAAGTILSSVTSTDATASSSARPNSEATDVFFEWGTTPSYGQTTATLTLAGTGAAPESVTAPLTGLTPSTTYHVRLVAVNATGTSTGPDRTFATTAAGAPSATTLPTTDLGPTTATLRGSVNPENLATTYQFEWGPTTAYPNRVPASGGAVPNDGVEHPVSDPLSGLAPNTTYHARVVATSAVDTTRGADETFTTDAPRADATTTAATSIGTDRATLAGLVDPQNSTTTYRFEWGTTDAYENSLPIADEVVGDDHTPHAVTRELTGLTPDTTYHFRVVATNNTGESVGADRSLITASIAASTPSVGPGTGSSAPSTGVPALRAELGRLAVASVVRGTIRVRVPGSTEIVELRDGVALPSGSVIDTRNGTIELESAVDRAGHTQRASFRGAVFAMALSRRDAGVVDLRLTQAPTGCRRARFAARAAGAANAPIKLWAKDHRGRYRTHGRNSVATVRGTEWTTTETCEGTLTRVMNGSVSVRDLRVATRTLVRAGHTYLAFR